MFRTVYRSSSGALTVTTCVCKPEAENTVRAPDDEWYTAQNMFSL